VQPGLELSHAKVPVLPGQSRPALHLWQRLCLEQTRACWSTRVATATSSLSASFRRMVTICSGDLLAPQMTSGKPVLSALHGKHSLGPKAGRAAEVWRSMLLQVFVRRLSYIACATVFRACVDGAKTA